MLGTRKGVEIGEYAVALQRPGILYAEMVGVGVHAHHLLAYILGRIRQIDAVTQRLAHLGLAVGAGQTQARGILREQDLGLDQRRAVNRVELVDYLAGSVPTIGS